MRKKNKLYNWFEITMPYVLKGLEDKEGTGEYYSILKNTIFPAIDKLFERGLINNYNFLNHNTNNYIGLHLRISMSDNKNTPKVTKILEEFNIPTELKKWGDNRNPIEDDILRLNADIMRMLLNHRSPDKFYPSVVHYQNNCFGMTNLDEVNFHLNEAINWLVTLYINNGINENIAVEKAIKDILKNLEKRIRK